MSDDHWERLVHAHGARANSQVETAPSDRPPRHEPAVAVLACSDARVPPSVVFDQPAGSLFVVRIAGNTASPAALASFDYAVEVLGVELLVVLGHTSCGAVQAAIEGTCGGHLAPIVASICELARTVPGADIDRVAQLNVASTVHDLENHPGPVGQAAAAGRLEIRGAMHDLRSGLLEPLPISPDHNPPLSPVEAS